MRNIALIGEDWGSLIGLRVLIDNLELFQRLIVANGGLPPGDREPRKAFKVWLDYLQKTEPFVSRKRSIAVVRAIFQPK